MSTLFNDETPSIFPKTSSVRKVGYINSTSPLVKLEIIKEGEGLKARNANKLDLSNSIYEKLEEE